MGHSWGLLWRRILAELPGDWDSVRAPRLLPYSREQRRMVRNVRDELLARGPGELRPALHDDFGRCSRHWRDDVERDVRKDVVQVSLEPAIVVGERLVLRQQSHPDLRGLQAKYFDFPGRPDERVRKSVRRIEQAHGVEVAEDNQVGGRNRATGSQYFAV